jgi:hypothetical protein
MLDPLTALSLAGTIVQFVDFSSKIVSKTRELSKSAHGATEEAFNVEIVTRDLLRLSQSLRNWLRLSGVESDDKDDQDLEALCDGCIYLPEKLLARLRILKVQHGAGKVQVLQQAIKTVWSRRELDQLAEQLDEYRRQLDLHVFVSFR